MNLLINIQQLWQKVLWIIMSAAGHRPSTWAFALALPRETALCSDSAYALVAAMTTALYNCPCVVQVACNI